MAGIFKAYDIRGIYGKTLTDDMAFKIARAFATFLKCQPDLKRVVIVVGRDMRPHSIPVAKAVTDGLTLHGADIVDLGLCSSPMAYYTNVSLRADAGIMITASHNPAEWNGLKLTGAGCVPIGADSGMQDIERIVERESFDPPAAKPGSITRHDALPDYTKHVAKSDRLARPVRIVADMANAMGIVEAGALPPKVEVTPMFDTLDGTFPNHEANPLKQETLKALQQKVAGGGFDFGVAFDGDADRIGLVDEHGQIVPTDIVTALIARDILEGEKGGVVLYDLRSSRAVREVIEESGGKPIMCRVGHAFIKKQMRETNAIFAGELSGHYYFRDNFFTESTALAIVRVANIVTRAGAPLSELVKPLSRYCSSGEINSTVKNAARLFQTIKRKYSDARLLELDGVSVDYDDWWFNIRASNTEPLVRLNLEAQTEEQMREKLDEVTALIRDAG